MRSGWPNAGSPTLPTLWSTPAGVINIAEELAGYHQERAYASIRRIYDTTRDVLADAERRGITPEQAASERAAGRIRQVGRLSGLRTFDRSSRSRRR